MCIRDRHTDDGAAQMPVGAGNDIDLSLIHILNQYETQAMRRLLEAEGFETGEFVPGDEAALSADGLVINSCTVTGESDRKLRQLLRRCRRDNPHAVLALTGCMPQAFPCLLYTSRCV